MKEFLWAFRFLTIIPLGYYHYHGEEGKEEREREEIQPQRMGVVMTLFPVVGLVIGLLLVVVYVPLVMVFPGRLADALVILTFILITGGLHLDGLADSVDGLFGGWDAGQRLEIMKDSRIGTFGVVSLVVVIGLKYLSFNEIGGYVAATDNLLEPYLPAYGSCAEKASVLLLMPVMGRWSQTLAAGLYPYAREEPGTAEALVSNTHLRHAIAASTVPVVLAAFLLGYGKAVIITAVLALLIVILSRYVNSRTGGLTGDTLGAINELTELTFLLLFYII